MMRAIRGGMRACSTAGVRRAPLMDSQIVMMASLRWRMLRTWYLACRGAGGGGGGREREDEQWKNASEGTAHATTKRQQKARHTKAHRRT